MAMTSSTMILLSTVSAAESRKIPATITTTGGSSTIVNNPLPPVAMPCPVPLSPWGQRRLKQREMVLEEDRAYIPGVLVKAATPNALARQLVQAFVGGLNEDTNQFPRIMLLMHQWFDTSEGLAHRLVNLFWKSEQMYPCIEYGCSHKTSKCTVYQRRHLVCCTFRFWIERFPIHFDSNPTLVVVLQEFQSHLRDRAYPELSDLIDLTKIPSYAWTRNISVRNPSEKHTRKVSLVLDLLEPHELADHLTFLEHKTMSRITFTDFRTYALCGTPQNNPSLERSISLFNGLTQWIQCMVLRCKLPQQRADIICKFVNVAKRLLEMNNFNTLMAVVSGLNHSSLARLNATRACVPQETDRSLTELTELLSSTSNFTNYRRLLAQSKGFRIPYLGVHMKDLICLHVALPDTLITPSDNPQSDIELVNFRKVTQLSVIFKELWELQNTAPPVSVSLDLVTTLKLSLEKEHSDDEIYELSLSREPRPANPSSTSPNRPIIFSSWVSDLECSSSSSQDLDLHLDAVTDFVFRKYDQDRDGYLDRKDFDIISKNYAFLQTFQVLDTNNDGLISRSELKRFFETCQVAIKLAFSHHFHETTYFKPTFCAHCTGLLWGLIKQGYKCKDCGINSHKHCKNMVVMECSKQPPNSSSCSSSRSHSFNSESEAPLIRRRGHRHARRHGNPSVTSDNEDKTTVIMALLQHMHSNDSQESSERSLEEDDYNPNDENGHSSNGSKEGGISPNGGKPLKETTNSTLNYTAVSEANSPKTSRRPTSHTPSSCQRPTIGQQ